MISYENFILFFIIKLTSLLKMIYRYNLNLDSTKFFFKEIEASQEI